MIRELNWLMVIRRVIYLEIKSVIIWVNLSLINLESSSTIMAGKYQHSSREMNVPSTAAGYSNNRFECNPYANSGDYIVSKPKKPTPLNLYLGSRMEELTALGKTKDEAFKICTLQYKEMPEEEKVLWILQALKKEPEYTV